MLRCPGCGLTNQIVIAATIEVLLLQGENDDDDEEEFETAEYTKAGGSHEWDGESRARCDGCNYVGYVRHFDPSEVVDLDDPAEDIGLDDDDDDVDDEFDIDADPAWDEDD